MREHSAVNRVVVGSSPTGGAKKESHYQQLVLMTQGVHPFPSRTRKLSPVVPKIVLWRRSVKIGRCQHLIMRFFYFLLTSVEGKVQLGEPKEYSLSTVGVDDAGGPPVSIPNTEVKPCSAENSALATECEDRKMPTFDSEYFLCKTALRFYEP